MGIPAREMSKETAFAELVGLVDSGIIKFEGQSDANHVNLDGHDPNTGAEQAGNVAGVVIRFGNSAAAPDFLDPRNALALVRFCQFLSSEFDVTDLLHLGISGDATGVRRDCHGQGRAVDFAGAARRRGDRDDFELSVLNDWGSANTALTPGGDWPPETGGNVGYRLEGSATFAETFFRRVYEFIANEWQDRSAGPDPESEPTSIGMGSFIMHPDHPTSARAPLPPPTAEKRTRTIFTCRSARRETNEAQRCRR
jgi:hypothetical protein